MISFTVPGNPVAKGRARATMVAGRARMYTPSKTVSYEGKVALFASQAMNGLELLIGPVSLDLVLHMPIPASWSGKKTKQAIAGEIIPTVKPDCSNVLKAIEDAMNGIVYKDDSQISDVSIRRCYSASPKVVVYVGVLL